MFEDDVSELGLAEALAATAQWRALRDHAEARLVELAQRVADLSSPDIPAAVHPSPEGEIDQADRGHRRGLERSVLSGGAGCAAFKEFVTAEFGAMLKVSAGTARQFIGQALALRHRLPRVWAAVLAGEATAWKARHVAWVCRELSVEAVAVVDARVAGIVDSVSWYRLGKILTAAVYEADPAAAHAAAEQKASERGVYLGRVDEHGTRAAHVYAATGDVLRFDAAVNDVADALAEFGDADPLRLRRAKAVGILADPDHAVALLDAAGAPHRSSALVPASPPATTAPSRTPVSGLGALGCAGLPSPLVPPVASAPGAPAPVEPWDEPDLEPEPMDAAQRQALNARLAGLPGITTSPATGRRITTERVARTVVYVHVTDRSLATGTGVVRVEGAGPLLATQLTELIGHRPYLVKPVIDLNQQISVDAYEIPRRIRERTKLTYPVEQFPYGTAETTFGTDLDHIEPFDRHGPPGQTSTTNLAPLRRFSHRVKTHGRWRVRRLPDGALEWTSPHDFRFRVDHTGTHPIDPPECPRVGL
jgi:hypothetical protein